MSHILTYTCNSIAFHLQSFTVSLKCIYVVYRSMNGAYIFFFFTLKAMKSYNTLPQLSMENEIFGQI